ncbi:MAG: hypothetical protein IT243_00520 [Bacteroidia bacterium]|nr:hypothetical protein [Bacteroidia bacterium]
MNSYRVYLVIFVLLSNFVYSQKSMLSNYGGVIYKFSGIGIALQKKLETDKNFGKQYDIEFAGYKHPKEIKTFNSEIANSTPFVFGKLNKVAILKAKYSISKNISEFTDDQRIGIDILIGGGIAFGILKPVYINQVYPDGHGFEIIVSEKYNPEKHKDISSISGYSDFRTGLNETTYKTGITATLGIGFTWGYFDNYPKRLETGYFIEYFPKGLPIMAFVKNNPIQNGVFIKMLFGKRIFNN